MSRQLGIHRELKPLRQRTAATTHSPPTSLSRFPTKIETPIINPKKEKKKKNRVLEGWSRLTLPSDIPVLSQS